MRVEWVALAAICSALLTWALAHFSGVLGMIDHPGGHKHHREPVAMVGGLAIALAVTIVLSFSAATLPSAQRVLLAAAFAMLLIGLADDRVRLGAYTRLLAQAIVAMALGLAGDTLLIDLGALFDGEDAVRLGWLALPLTIFSVVGVMNACNMSDGMDGAAAGMVVLALGGAIFLAFGHAFAPQVQIAATVLGAVLGFMVWNMPLLRSARAYLGDGGSLLLGTFVAWTLVAFSQGADRAFAPVVALWLYAVPLIDTVSVMWRRVSEGRSPFQPDQRHLHHMLLRAGVSARKAWLILMLAAFACVLVAIAATRASWPEPAMAAAFLVMAFSHHWLMRSADRSGRWCGRTLAASVAASTLPLGRAEHD